MGFGISSFVSRGTRKALIRWVDPEDEKQQVKDNSLGEEVEGQSFADNAKNFLTLALVGDLATRSITPDVRKSEVHKFRSNITEVALEDGSIAAQHIIQRPIEMTLQFEETNSGKMIANVLSSLGFIDQVSTYDKLTDLWRRKIPVTIITEQAQYDNMAIENMPIVQQQPYKGALKIMVDFKQLSYYTLAGFQHKGKSEDIDKSVSSEVEGGTQTVTDIDVQAPDVEAPSVVGGRVIEPGEYYEASSRAEAEAIIDAGGISW